MKVRRSLLKDTVVVATYAGEGAYGPVYGAATTVRCNVQAKRRLVRNANGDEVISDTTLQVHPDDAGKFMPESTVTINDAASRVLATRSHQFRGSTAFCEVVCV